jgi:predicted nucleic acid-binding protein
MTDGNAIKKPRSGFDTIIAAVAEANDCIVVTDNEKDFPGIEILNPLRQADNVLNRK